MKHDTPTEKNYSHCLIKPMAEEDDQPIIEPTHILDALIVAAIVFFSVLTGDALLQIYSGNPVFITWADLIQRILTAVLAFCMVFFAQWARYRGVKFMVDLPITVNVPEEQKEDSEE